MNRGERDSPVIDDVICGPDDGRDPRDADVAVARLFSEHYGGMVRLARLLVDDLATAEDVAQDAFAALHVRWRRLRDEASAIAYLRSCVLNGARDRLRRRRLARAVDPGPDPRAMVPDGLAERHELEDLMIRTLRTIPRRQREVLVLRYYLDLTERTSRRCSECHRVR